MVEVKQETGIKYLCHYCEHEIEGKLVALLMEGMVFHPQCYEIMKGN